jgi:hypothetical protein
MNLIYSLFFFSFLDATISFLFLRALFTFFISSEYMVNFLSMKHVKLVDFSTSEALVGLFCRYYFYWLLGYLASCGPGYF